ncbi:MAG: hypothetical protein K2Y39_05205 [Candidatus Obscuribacterales bacterium]|nr:hypothetical protein [Candidatus Obscuribacterales bacterium]
MPYIVRADSGYSMLFCAAAANDPALVNESGEAFAMSNAHLDNAKYAIVK